jgi:hypothetical protein
MHKNATKCNETLGKWCKNKHGASKIMDTLETYQRTRRLAPLKVYLIYMFLMFTLLALVVVPGYMILVQLLIFVTCGINGG